MAKTNTTEDWRALVVKAAKDWRADLSMFTENVLILAVDALIASEAKDAANDNGGG